MKEKIKRLITSNKTGEYLYHRFLDTKYNILQLLPLKKRIKLQYYMRTKMKLNLEHPQTMSDWINVQKINKKKHKKMSDYSDKYKVKKIVDSYNTKCKTIDTIKAYNTVNELKEDIDSFTYPIVIKINFGSGGTYSIKNINDFYKIEQDLNYRFNVKYSKFSSELHYDLIDRKILVEPYIGEELSEYKIYCAKGKILFYYLYKNVGNDIRDMRDGLNPRSTFTPDDKIAPFVVAGRKNDIITSDVEVNEMKEIAKLMSREFDLVRIDFLFDGKTIYFGEFTFISDGGYLKISPKKYDCELGSEISNIIKG